MKTNNYEIQTLQAYLKSLQEFGILTKVELKKALTQAKKGKITNKKALIAHSKKDQHQTALRLEMKEGLTQIKKTAKKLAGYFLEFASENQQQAIQSSELSSLAHYFCSYTESIMDDLDFLSSVQSLLDKSPLGSLNGFGTHFLIPRESARKELKFKKLQINSLYCARSKEKFSRLHAEVLSQIMLSLSLFANDSLNFLKDQTLKLRKSYEPKDLRKILKLKRHTTETTLQSLETALKFTKAFQTSENTSKAKKSQIIKKLAIQLAIEKKTHLEMATKRIQKNFNKFPNLTPQELLKSKISLGAPGNLDINHYKNRLRKV
ncbi:hypothetical protein JKY72_00215 [Candidatus Gracilibacteria bacterium]|nr:hypothetical protein [Candidatus Gracilibacteria bacterium]